MTAPTATGYLTPADLASRYSVPLQTIYAWNHKRTGPPYLRLGRHVRYRPADVTAWEHAHTAAGARAS